MKPFGIHEIDSRMSPAVAFNLQSAIGRHLVCLFASFLFIIESIYMYISIFMVFFLPMLYKSMVWKIPINPYVPRNNVKK